MYCTGSPPEPVRPGVIFRSAALVCKARIYSAGFRGFIWRGQVPMTRVSRAASTTSTVMASSWLMLMSLAIWPKESFDEAEVCRR